LAGGLYILASLKTNIVGSLNRELPSWVQTAASSAARTDQ